MFYIQYVKEILGYLYTYNMTPRDLAMTMIQDVLKATGITATAGKEYAKKRITVI